MSTRQIALISAVSVALLSACSSTKVEDSALVNKAASAVAGVVIPDHLNPNSLISTQRSVYFDFDKFNVKSSETVVVERQGKYLAANAGLNVRVEGNADERGGREYNLALGQKRADAVTRALKVYGAKDGQMEAVSFGSEKPKAAGHDEAAWAQNRRVDVTYPSK